MKKLTILLTTLALLTACTQSAPEDLAKAPCDPDLKDCLTDPNPYKDDLSQQESAPEQTIAQKIEDLSLYKPLTQEDIAGIGDCGLINLGSLDDVKKLSLFKGVERWSVSIYMTPKREMGECDELGGLMMLKEAEDYNLVWTPLGCGWEVGEFFENETDESKACSLIGNQVLEYEIANKTQTP
jgi:hypothetical protein